MIASGASVADVARVVRPSRAEPYSNYINPAIPVVIAPDMVQQEKGGHAAGGLVYLPKMSATRPRPTF